MKLVVNKCFGGFGLSPKAIQRLAELQGKPCYFFKHQLSSGSGYEPMTLDEASSYHWVIYAFDEATPKDNDNTWYYAHTLNDWEKRRDDALLVQVVEELGEEANGQHAKLEIVEIPDDIEWQIEEYDGNEHVAEAHRTW